VGHHYWSRLIENTPEVESFRAPFGDERISYDDAKNQHYGNGEGGGWTTDFVSSYATMHPWEDWAETWAHYLHMADTADTAMSFGVDASNVEVSNDLFEPTDLWQPDHPGATKFLEFLNGWVRLTNVLNELSRSMGQPDYYPFVLPRAAVGKLQFIHQVITEQRMQVKAEVAAELAVPLEAVIDDATTDSTAPSMVPDMAQAPSQNQGSDQIALQDGGHSLSETQNQNQDQLVLQAQQSQS